ncbi:Hypoxia induced protein conserved region [Fragilaria crotonensis]|nr:Hypoxia induced protein conserved region [Fragilaria crotonensis]
MVSLTPQENKAEVAGSAVREGAINGIMALIPSYGLFLVAMKNSPKFVKYTNWQSRTSIVLLPACFTFAFTSERALDHKMREMADRNDHLRKTAIWADEKHAEQQRLGAANASSSSSAASPSTPALSTEKQLLDLYRQSVKQSGVRIVPELHFYHKIANFWQEHPFRILAAAAVPAFTVLAILLTLMGFKGYMDTNGKFITEEDAERSVMEMAQVREGLLQRLAKDKQHQAEIDSLLQKAHDEDVKTGHTHEKKRKKGKKDHSQTMQEISSV